MDPKKLVSLAVAAILIIAIVLAVIIFNLPGDSDEDGEDEIEEFTKVGVLEFYFKDRYGCSVQSHLYYPSHYGASSPPVKGDNGYPAIVFGCGYKGDNSIYEWLALNLSQNGYVVLIPDFVNNTSPWAETDNGWIAGLNCDTYGGNASLPSQYYASNELWPDVWPWVHELIDSAKFLINATNNDYSFFNGNITVELGGLVDTERLGVMGHSTGGSMALVSAMIYKWFKVAVAFAPYDNALSGVYWPPFPSDYLMHQRATPLMIMVGTRDVLAPAVSNSEQIYSHASTPKIMVEILDGNHVYFCDSEDIFKPNLMPLQELPITPTPLDIGKQQEIAMNFTTNFLDHYLNPPASRSPYSMPDDLDGDRKSDVNKSFEIGPVIKFMDSHLDTELNYIVTAEVVPLGIGWGNSTVVARFYDLLLREATFSPVTMVYQYGTYQDEYAGLYLCRISQKAYSFLIEARSTTGEVYRSDTEILIVR